MHPSPFLYSSSLRGVAWQARSRPVLLLTVTGIISLLLGIGSLIVARRLAGALSSDMPRDAMLLSALVSTSVLACSRIAWRQSFPLSRSGGETLLDQCIGWGSSLALAILAVGCCYPANRTSDWLIWLPLLVADQLWRQNFFDAGRPTARLTKQENNSVISPLANHDDIVQQLFRVREDQEHDIIYGTLRADFQAGQRTAVIHVGFCPPLEYLPEIEAESLSGQPTRIKVVQALSHGVRLDVRLAAATDEETHVWIDMAARPISPRKPQGMSA